MKGILGESLLRFRGLLNFAALRMAWPASSLAICPIAQLSRIFARLRDPRLDIFL